MDKARFCCWKLESSWDEAWFVRQKTYMEHVVAEDLEPIANPYWSIKCAGMPERCKSLYAKSMEGYVPDGTEGYSREELEFLKTTRTPQDFRPGLSVPGKLRPVRIPGGVVLMDTPFVMHAHR